MQTLNRYEQTLDAQAANPDITPVRQSILLPKGQEHEAQWLSAFAGGAHRYFICRRTDCGPNNLHY
eukprot:4721860-Prorocentrum_lima.AAC.1